MEGVEKRHILIVIFDWRILFLMNLWVKVEYRIPNDINTCAWMLTGEMERIVSQQQIQRKDKAYLY